MRPATRQTLSVTGLPDGRTGIGTSTLTSSSWINRLRDSSPFALCADKQIKRGTHKWVKQLIAAIEVFTEAAALDQSADEILASIERFCRRTFHGHAQSG
jgi:hypothetical protein